MIKGCAIVFRTITFQAKAWQSILKRSMTGSTVTSTIDVKPRDQNLRVIWNKNDHNDYPHIFLRDNCQCAHCFDSTAQQRLLFTVQDVDLDIQPKDSYWNIERNELVVNWEDGHQSVFSEGWLKERQFPETKKDIKPSYLMGQQTKLWPDNLRENLPFIEYDALMSDNQVLVDHVENLISLGISVIKGAPKTHGVLENFIKDRCSLGYLRTTHYGDIFTVKAKPSPSNIAYTANSLPLHVDLPYYSCQPEIQFLHCIEQSSGDNAGVNELADGFKVAAELKQRDIKLYDLLTKVQFKFEDIGNDAFGSFKFEYERPIISLDSFGNVDGVSYNNHVRSSFINTTCDEIYEAYEAIYALTNLLYDNKNIIQYKMEPGDILTFNNKRVLHGRTSYDSKTTSRWLEGMYLDWDAVLSKYRVMKSMQH